MPYSRRRRPGLLGTVARTAVVTGTASATANAVHRGSQRRAEEQAQAAAFRAQQSVSPAPPAGPPATGADLVAQLGDLGRLHESGTLTDAEFAAAKQALIGR